MIAMGHHGISPRSAWAGPSARASRILLVEDDWLLSEFAASLLGEAGHEVESACDAAAGFRLLVRERFDLLVTDIDLGVGPDGLELARYAALANPDLPILYVSGRAHVDRSDLARNSLFLPKPYHPRVLLDCAYRLLAREGRLGSQSSA